MELLNRLLILILTILKVVIDFFVFLGKFLWEAAKSLFSFIFSFIGESFLNIDKLGNVEPISLKGHELILLPIVFILVLLWLTWCYSIYKKNRINRN